MTSDPVAGELSVVEQEEAFLVVVDGDADDWLVRFEKAEGFPAGGWAANMAVVYNRRRGGLGAPEARWGAGTLRR